MITTDTNRISEYINECCFIILTVSKVAMCGREEESYATQIYRNVRFSASFESQKMMIRLFNWSI